MLNSLLIFAKRVALFLPVLAIGYVSVFNIFPWLNDALPLVFAILLTYVLGAYVLIPAVIRSARIIFPAKHLPLYCVTRDGFASDPLNIGLVGTRDEIVKAMEAAGWHPADKITVRSSIRILLSTVYGWSYPTAPMSNLYLFGRPQDVAFQRHVDGGAPGSRHHVRFWAANYKDETKLTVSSIDWHNRDAHVRDDTLLWVGAASRDVGVAFVRHNAQLTHIVDPNTDGERELLTKHLKLAGWAEAVRSITLGDPYKLLNVHGWMGHIHTDGTMKILRLRKPAMAKMAAKHSGKTAEHSAQQ